MNTKQLNLFQMRPSIIFLIIVTLFFISCQKQTPMTEKEKYSHKIDSLNKLGFEVTDYHAHLKGGLTIDELIAHGDSFGIKYGVAINCGMGFPVDNDSLLSLVYHEMRAYPVLIAMQAEGREWVTMVSRDSAELFDYIFTDAMTFYDRNGRRTRLWIPEEVYIDDKDTFMDDYISRIESILDTENIDIYVNPTFLPEKLLTSYDALWTDTRIDRMIDALKRNQIAMEINTRYKIPSEKIIKKAKAAGVLFTLGTNNGDANMGYLAYGIDMINACDLKPSDFWRPRP